MTCAKQHEVKQEKKDDEIKDEKEEKPAFKEIKDEDLDDLELLEPKSMQKMQSAMPEFMKIAASPEKDQNDQHKKERSKVLMKRHHLYTELKQIPVHVEQSSCIQVLEDFLRNRVKTTSQVKGLKYDYGFGGPGRGPPGSYPSPFGNAFGGHY